MANFGAPQKVSKTTEIFEQDGKMTTMARDAIHMPGTDKMKKEKITKELSVKKNNEGQRSEYSGRSKNSKINADELLKFSFQIA